MSKKQIEKGDTVIDDVEGELGKKDEMSIS